MKNVNKSVAFVIPTLEYGGAETQMINQINALCSLGFIVHLIVFGSSTPLRKKINLVEDKVLFLYQKQSALTGKAVFGSFAIVKPILTYLKRKNVDVVIANLPFAHLVMRFTKLASKINRFNFKLINYHHALQYEESPLNTLAKIMFNKFCSSLAMLSDDLNIFISEAVKHNISTNFKVNAFIVIRNAVPYKDIDASLAETYCKAKSINLNKFKVILPGRLNEAKGQLFFIEAFKKFIKEKDLLSKDIVVFLVGGGKLVDRIVQEIKKEDLHDYFYITDFVTNDLMLSFMALSDLVVIPSIVEGFGNVAIEAMMTRSLILSSDAGGLKEIISDGRTGFTFAANNKEELVNKISMIYNNRDKCLIDQNVLEEDYFGQYTFEAHVDQLVKAIDLCAG